MIQNEQISPPVGSMYAWPGRSFQVVNYMEYLVVCRWFTGLGSR